MNEPEKSVEIEQSGGKVPRWALANIAEFLKWRRQEYEREQREREERLSQHPSQVSNWFEASDELALVPVSGEAKPQVRTLSDLPALVQREWGAQMVQWDWDMMEASLHGGNALLAAMAEMERGLAHWNGVLIGLCELALPRVIALGMAQIAASKPVYLPLPKRLAAIEREPLYQKACHYGRLLYRASLLSVNEETFEVVRAPGSCSRQEIYHFIDETVRIPADARLSAMLPLSYRVGVAVGWLSALSVSQKEDAGAGMVMLAVLVAPLLLSEKQAGQHGQMKRLKAAKSRKGGRL